MTKNEKLISYYNNPDAILVISSYPERGVRYSGKVCAVGGFTRNTLEALKKRYTSIGENRKMVVLTIVTEREEIYEEDGILVIRCFRRNNIFSYKNLWAYINRFTLIKDVFVEFEFASFGDTWVTAPFPLLLLGAKLIGKNILLVLHQVLTSTAEISGHIGVDKKDIRIKLFDLVLNLYYRLFCAGAHKIVVLEDEFKLRLEKISGRKDIEVIPHGVDTSVKIIAKNIARRKLKIGQNELVVLYFGYLTWYKGADIFAKAFAGKKMYVNGKKVRFIMAGGESFTQKNKKHYHKFVTNIYDYARAGKNLKITGFLEEKLMPYYFAVCDLVVLPYRTFMSSSGPLSLAVSFKKPFIVSSQLNKLLDSQDIKKLLAEMNLKKENITFSPTETDLKEKTVKMLHTNQREKLQKFSQGLRLVRDYDNLITDYTQVISQLRKNYIFLPQPKIKLATEQAK